MLSNSSGAFAAALEETAQHGAAKIERALTGAAQRELLAALDAADFERAPERVSQVEQDFDMVAIKLADKPTEPGLTPVFALADEYTAFLRQQAHALDLPRLADFTPTDVHVQRYRPGSRGITPHRDGRRFVTLISIFSLGNSAQFVLCRDRQGTPLRRYRLASGDLLLLRAAGFARDSSPGPMHAVSGPEEGVRYSITFRMEQASACRAGRAKPGASARP